MKAEASLSLFGSLMADEESELLAQLFGNHPFASGQEHEEPSMVMQSLFWSDHGIDPYCVSHDINANMYYCPMENGSKTSEHEDYFNNMESNIITTIGMIYDQEPMLLNMEEEEEDDDDEGKISTTSVMINRKDHPEHKRKIQICDTIVNSKKDHAFLQDGKSSGKSTKSRKTEKKVTASVLKNPCCYSSENEASISQELNREDGPISSLSPSPSLNPRRNPNPKASTDLSSNGKKRAGRGSATDPQSLYARKRRERINERLKILQNLVPNGTKVDISTMLEEAVQYVKFLQLQIKLLSSDDLWMYAPIAYNGMNIGIDLKISPS